MREFGRWSRLFWSRRPWARTCLPLGVVALSLCLFSHRGGCAGTCPGVVETKGRDGGEAPSARRNRSPACVPQRHLGPDGKVGTGSPQSKIGGRVAYLPREGPERKRCHIWASVATPRPRWAIQLVRGSVLRKLCWQAGLAHRLGFAPSSRPLLPPRQFRKEGIPVASAHTPKDAHHHYFQRCDLKPRIGVHKPELDDQGAEPFQGWERL